MAEPVDVDALTADERHVLRLLRQEPQSLQGLAEAIGRNPEQTQHLLQRLARKVGLVGVPGAMEQKTTGVGSFRSGHFAENDRWGWACIARHSRRIPEPFEPCLTDKSYFRSSLLMRRRLAAPAAAV